MPINVKDVFRCSFWRPSSCWRTKRVFSQIFRHSFWQPPNFGRPSAVKQYTRLRSSAPSGDDLAPVAGTSPAPLAVSTRANRATYAPVGATRSTPSDRLDIAESRSKEISAVQASTPLRKDLSFCQHGLCAGRFISRPGSILHACPCADNLSHAPHTAPNLGVCTTRANISSLLLSYRVSSR